MVIAIFAVALITQSSIGAMHETESQLLEPDEDLGESDDVDMADSENEAMGMRLKAEESEMLNWSYKNSSKAGPAHWGRFSAGCANGMLQSPIALSSKHSRAMGKLTPLMFSYSPSVVELFNNGKLVRGGFVNAGFFYEGNDPTKRFSLKSVEFHSPSEHTVDGHASDAEVQLIHERPDGRLVIVAVLLNVGSDTNPFLKDLWPSLPRGINRNTKSARADPTDALPVGAFLAQNGAESYYSYIGSLTSPPCDEGVTWYVLKDQGVVTGQQLQEMQVVLDSRHLGEDAMEVLDAVLDSKPERLGMKPEARPRMSNARPVQNLNGRQVNFNNADASTPYHAVMISPSQTIECDKRHVEATLRMARKAVAKAAKIKAKAKKEEKKAAGDRAMYFNVLNNATAAESKIARKLAGKKIKKAVKKATAMAKAMDNHTINRLKGEIAEAKQIMLKQQATVKAEKKALQKEGKLLSKATGRYKSKLRQKIKKVEGKDAKTTKAILHLDHQVEKQKVKSTLDFARKAVASAHKEVLSIKQAIKLAHPAAASDAVQMGESDGVKSQPVEGTVVFPDSYSPEDVPGYIKLHRVDSFHKEKPVMGVIKHNGKFSLSAAPGSYIVESVVRGLKRHRELLHLKLSSEAVPVTVHLDSADGGEAIDRDVELGESMGIDDEASSMTESAELPLPMHSSITGFVATSQVPHGAADLLGYVKVRPCCDREAKPQLMSMVSHGTFSVDHLAAGTYTIETIIPGHESKFTRVAVDESTPHIVHIAV